MNITQEELRGRRLAAPKLKKAGRSTTECECEDGKPTVAPFEVDNCDGFHCTRCMHVLEWNLNGKGPIIRQVMDRLDAEVVSIAQNAAEKPTPAPTPAPAVPQEPLQDAYFINNVFAVDDKPDHMSIEFTADKGYSVFKFEVKSTEEKVALAIKDKSRLVAKYGLIEFTSYLSEGSAVPKDPKLLKVLPTKPQL